MIKTHTSLILAFALATAVQAVVQNGLPGGYHAGEMEDCKRVLSAVSLDNKSYLKNQKIVTCWVQIVAGRNFFIQVEPFVAFRDSKSHPQKPKTSIKIFEGLDGSLTVESVESDHVKTVHKVQDQSLDGSPQLLGGFESEKVFVCKKVLAQVDFDYHNYLKGYTVVECQKQIVNGVNYRIRLQNRHFPELSQTIKIFWDSNKSKQYRVESAENDLIHKNDRLMGGWRQVPLSDCQHVWVAIHKAKKADFDGFKPVKCQKQVVAGFNYKLSFVGINGVKMLHEKEISAFEPLDGPIEVHDAVEFDNEAQLKSEVQGSFTETDSLSDCFIPIRTFMTSEFNPKIVIPGAWAGRPFDGLMAGNLHKCSKRTSEERVDYEIQIASPEIECVLTLLSNSRQNIFVHRPSEGKNDCMKVIQRMNGLSEYKRT